MLAKELFALVEWGSRETAGGPLHMVEAVCSHGEPAARGHRSRGPRGDAVLAIHAPIANGAPRAGTRRYPAETRSGEGAVGHDGQMTPEALLSTGNVVLAEVLVPAGFVLSPITTGRGSGGSFAVARWNRDTQAIELHVRFGLGVVHYCWGDQSFDHRHVVDALGVAASYPGFSADPVDAFRHLAEDLCGPLASVVGPDHRNAFDVIRDWVPRGRFLP